MSDESLNVEVPIKDGDATVVSDVPETPSPDGEPNDPEFLAQHRRELLALQRLSAAELAAQMRSPHRGDLVIAVLYTVYALPLGLWVARQSRSEETIAGPLAIVAVAGLFGVILWRSYLRSLAGKKRARIYEGRFVETRIDRAIFDGGEVFVPAHLQRELVPGVRYRVHAGGTADVAIDVAIDEPQVERKLYR